MKVRGRLEDDRANRSPSECNVFGVGLILMRQGICRKTISDVVVAVIAGMVYKAHPPCLWHQRTAVVAGLAKTWLGSMRRGVRPLPGVQERHPTHLQAVKAGEREFKAENSVVGGSRRLLRGRGTDWSVAIRGGPWLGIERGESADHRCGAL